MAVKDLYKYNINYKDSQDIEFYKILYDAKLSKKIFVFNELKSVEDVKSFMKINFNLGIEDGYTDEFILNNPDIFIPLISAIKNFSLPKSLSIDGKSLDKLIRFDESYLLRKADVSLAKTIGLYIYTSITGYPPSLIFRSIESERPLDIPGLIYRNRNFDQWIKNSEIIPPLDMYYDFPVFVRGSIHLHKEIPPGTVYVKTIRIGKNEIIPNSVKYIECNHMPMCNLTENVTHLLIHDRADGDMLPRSLIYLKAQSIFRKANLPNIRFLELLNDTSNFDVSRMETLEYYSGSSVNLPSKNLKHLGMRNPKADLSELKITSLSLLLKKDYYNIYNISIPSSVKSLYLIYDVSTKLNEGLEILNVTLDKLKIEYSGNKIKIYNSGKVIPKNVKLCFSGDNFFILSSQG